MARGERSAAGDDLPAPPVQLIREYKGPTVDQVLAASTEALDLLPGRVASMAQTLESSADLGAADRQMDRALGLLLQGPGHRKTGASAAAVATCAVVVVLFALLIWLMMT